MVLILKEKITGSKKCLRNICQRDYSSKLFKQLMNSIHNDLHYLFLTMNSFTKYYIVSIYTISVGIFTFCLNFYIIKFYSIYKPQSNQSRNSVLSYPNKKHALHN